MFMRTYTSSPVKRKSFYRKIELLMFLLISGGHIGGPKRYTDMASPHKALQTFRQITQKLWATIQRPETCKNRLYFSHL